MEQNIFTSQYFKQKTLQWEELICNGGKSAPNFQDPISFLLNIVNGLKLTFLVRTIKLWDNRTLVLEWDTQVAQW